MKDKKWYCLECGKKKENYEAMYCDKCWEEIREGQYEAEQAEKAKQDFFDNSRGV